MITFNHENFQKDVAYIVENDVLLNAVNQELASSDNSNQVEVIYNSKIKDYTLGEKSKDGETLVHMENGDTYACKLLVSNKKIAHCINFILLSIQYHLSLFSFALNFASNNFCSLSNLTVMSFILSKMILLSLSFDGNIFVD